MRSPALSVAILTSLLVGPAQSADVEIKTGFITGAQYRALGSTAKRRYAMGLLDGAFLAPFFGANKKEIAWLERCATEMDDAQIVAVFDRYLSDHPARWHYSMNVLGFSAMKDACAQ